MPRSGMGLVLAAAALLAGASAAAASDGAPAAAEKRKGSRVRRTPLVVKKLVPRHGAKFVALGAEVVVRFSAPVDPRSITPESCDLRRLLGDRVAWTLRMQDNDRTAVLVPRKPFEPGADYELVVGTTVAKPDGTRLRGRRRAIFFTDPRFSLYPVLRPDMFEDLSARMGEPRAAHTATHVGGDRILLAGGMSDGATMCATGELFDPQTKSFDTISTPLAARRAYHPAVAPSGNAVVLIGGWGGQDALSSVEVWDRFTTGFHAQPPMLEGRDFHAAVALGDGRVLVSGGLRYTGPGGAAVYSTTAEVREPDGTWRFTAGAPQRRRAGHTLTLLSDGTVLVVGGYPESSGFGASSEIYDPATDTFRFTDVVPRAFRQLHTATPLDDGRSILVADGGDAIVEVYDVALGRFLQVGGSSLVSRTRATASVLPTGDVLLAGGFERRGTETLILQGMDIYVRSAGDIGRVFTAGVIFKEPRAGHTAASTDDGRVLFAGGFSVDGGVNLDSAVLFTPPAPPDPAAK